MNQTKVFILMIPNFLLLSLRSEFEGMSLMFFRQSLADIISAHQHVKAFKYELCRELGNSLLFFSEIDIMDITELYVLQIITFLQ